MEPSKEKLVFQRPGRGTGGADATPRPVCPSPHSDSLVIQGKEGYFVAGGERSECCDREAGRGPAVSVCEGWSVHEYQVVTSTNLVAASLPIWSAVRADSQTAGRGRFQRTWVSDVGGLWLSAVLPSGRGPEWRALPLVVGLAVCHTLREFGADGLRMRWPNDVLAGHRKLAGLLLDQFAPGATVAGIGINVRNDPVTADQNLAGRVVRLADLLPEAPPLPELTRALLVSLRDAVGQVCAGGLRPLLSQINGLWGPPREVEVELGGPKPVRRGRFAGVDEQGRLLLGTGASPEAFFPHQVRHLTEI